MVEAAFAARKPMKRKRAKKRRDSRPRCDRNRCTRPQVVILEDGGWCKPHAKLLADALARAIVLGRDDWTCQRCGMTKEGGPIQWAHVKTRASLSIRWDPENSMALCKGCHYFFTVQPHRWDAFLDENWPGRRHELERKRDAAIAAGDKPDYAEIIASLRSQAAGL
jgi:5-methylcytosine-specific restriction endonuclease McrA